MIFDKEQKANYGIMKGVHWSMHTGMYITHTLTSAFHLPNSVSVNWLLETYSILKIRSCRACLGHAADTVNAWR